MYRGIPPLRHGSTRRTLRDLDPLGLRPLCMVQEAWSSGWEDGDSETRAPALVLAPSSWPSNPSWRHGCLDVSRTPLWYAGHTNTGWACVPRKGFMRAASLPSGFQVRPPTMDDLPAAFALMTMCEVAEYGAPDTLVDDMCEA